MSSYSWPHALHTPSAQQAPNMSSYSWPHALHTPSAQQSPNMSSYSWTHALHTPVRPAVTKHVKLQLDTRSSHSRQTSSHQTCQATAGHTLFTLPQPSRHRTCQATAGHTLFTLPSDQQSPNMSSYSWTHALHTLSAQQSPNITRHILSIRVYKTATETPSRSAADFIQSVSKHAAARQALKCCTVHCWTHHELLGKGPDGFLYFLRRQRLLLAISVW